MTDREHPRSNTARDEHLKLRLASSLQEARVGELMLLDNQGQVIDSKRRRRMAATSWSIWVSLSTGLAITWGILLDSVLFGGVLGIWLIASPFARRRSAKRIQRAVALVASGERDRARVAIDEILAKRPPKAYVPTLLFLRAKLSWQAGEFQQALDRYTTTMQRLRPEKQARSRVLYWACAFDRAQLYAVMGQLEQARLAREQLEEAPGGDYFYMERMLVDLMLGFHADDLSFLPDMESLYEWAKDVLRTNQFGLSLVLLAWAFDRHGDGDMAMHLLDEAPERLQSTFFAEAAPSVHAWMQSKVVAEQPNADERSVDE